jgi:DNA-binding CsgD family transcriptional regulator
MRTQREWTAKEREVVRRHYRHYRTLGLAALADYLGRSVPSVCGAAFRFGLLERRPRKRAEDHAGDILAFHASGMTPREIGDRIGMSRNAVRVFLRRRGLRSNGTDPDVRRQLKREEYRRVWKYGAQGCSLAEARAWGMKARAAGRGWPDALSARQCDYLDALEAGPLDSAALAARVGMGQRTTRMQMLRMMAHGLVERRPHPTDGRGAVWALAPDVRRHRATRERSEGEVPKCPKRLRDGDAEAC